jgi:hypothetical protein
MEVMFERVAGLDVGKASVTVCVRTPPPEGGDRRRTPRRGNETRTFKTTAPALRVMAGWLAANGVTIAAMESTAGRGRRLGRPDAGQLPVLPACPHHRSPRTRTCSGRGRGRALDPGVGLLHAQTRRALPRPWAGLARQTQRGSPHPPPGRPAAAPRPHRRDRPGCLTDPDSRAQNPRPDGRGADARARLTYSRVCVEFQRSGSHGRASEWGSGCAGPGSPLKSDDPRPQFMA